MPSSVPYINATILNDNSIYIGMNLVTISILNGFIYYLQWWGLHTSIFTCDLPSFETFFSRNA